MKKIKFLFLLPLLFFSISGDCANKVKKVEQNSKVKSASDYYNDVLKAYQDKKWEELVVISKEMMSRYGESPFHSEVSYYKGIAYFNLQDFDLSNTCFSNYLKHETTPKYFEESIEYKYQIAESFCQGARRHLFGMERLPRVLPAKEQALDIFDEIITALPRHDLTAKSLFKKGSLLCDFNDFKPSTESFQILIRRFPKHYLAPEAYLGIQEVYLKQSQQEFPDPDVLELAEINLFKFKESFPGDSKIENAEKMYIDMQDSFAKELFETGFFYERTQKIDAAILYYANVISQYPRSSFAEKAKRNMTKLEAQKPKNK